MSFHEYFRLPPEQRSTLRRGADSIDPAWRHQPSPRATYEARRLCGADHGAWPVNQIVAAVFRAAHLAGFLFRRGSYIRTVVQRAAVSAAILVAIAGPWYFRNLWLYHNLMATVESTSGAGLKQLIAAATALPWGQEHVETARSALWTGNNFVHYLFRRHAECHTRAADGSDHTLLFAVQADTALSRLSSRRSGFTALD